MLINRDESDGMLWSVMPMSHLSVSVYTLLLPNTLIFMSYNRDLYILLEHVEERPTPSTYIYI